MSNINRDIVSEDMKIITFVDENLAKDKLLIPTFQREFVWEPENIRKLWDSIFKFYPIGSILYWVTDNYLTTHRKLGGFEFPHDEDAVRKFKDWSYILDGQQRATSLLVSIYGGKGKVKEDKNFDYTMYFDSTNAEFFCANELKKRQEKVNPAFLVRLRDVPKWGFSFYKDVASQEGYNEDIERNLVQLARIFTDYKLVLIKIQGVDVDEVCEIFERVNQEGKKLDPVDIIIAKTYRNEDFDKGIKMFYLRDKLKELKEILSSKGHRFQDIGNLTIVQMISICLRKEETGTRKSFGITPKALYNLTTEDLENNWKKCKNTILDTIKLLSDLKVHGPNILPYAYLIFPLCYHIHNNHSPRLQIAKQWFWRMAFGLSDFRRADEVYNYCNEFFDKLEQDEEALIPKLTISRSKLVKSNYYYRGALSRAVLCILAKQNPRDFSDPDAEVLDNVYLRLPQAPELHHIYPRNFLQNIEGLPTDVSIDSLMNICYLRANTNIKIGDKNPLHYFKKFKNVKNFNNILESHLIPKEFIEKEEFKPEDYKEFLYARTELLCKRLKDELPDVEVDVVE